MLRRVSLFVLTLMSAVHVGETRAAVTPNTGDEGVASDNSVALAGDRDFKDKPRPPAVLGVRG